jgi:hypothetical protein
MPDPAMANPIDFDRMTCPTPLTDYEHVLLGHGSGGKLTADLIQRVFLPELGQRRPVQIGGPGDRPPGSLSEREWPARRRGWLSPPIRSSYGRCSSRGATSARWPSMEPSTISPWAESHAAVSVGRLHSRRRPAHERPSPDRRLDAPGLRRRQRAARDGRHKGCRPRGKGDQIFITTSGIGLCSGGAAIVDHGGSAGGPNRDFWHARRSRNRRHVAA